MPLLRKFIQEEILAKATDPREEIATVKPELASLEAEVNRLLDIATPANRDLVDERLGKKIRVRKQDLEARLADLERIDYQPIDLEAATREALARFRDVLEEAPWSSGRSSCAVSCTKSASTWIPPEA